MTSIPLEEINNPRPIFLQAVEEDKEYLAHFCKTDGKAVCNKAWMPHYGKMADMVTDYWKPSYLQLEHLAVICPECKKFFNDNIRTTNDEEDENLA